MMLKNSGCFWAPHRCTSQHVRSSFSYQVRSADDFVRQYVQSELSVMGQDMICHEDLPFYSKGTGVVCTDQAGIRGHEYIISFLGVIYAPWTSARP